jgi:hypothetical protein
MVRRRSTVRFRNGAPAHRPVPDKEPALLTLVQQWGSFAQPVAELAERVAGRGRGDLGVDLHSEALLLCRNLHGHTRVHVQGGHGDRRYPRLGDAAVEAAAEVTRFDRGAVPGGGHQAGVVPSIVRTVAIGLLLSAELQRRNAQVRQRKQCLGGFGLGLPTK